MEQKVARHRMAKLIEAFADLAANRLPDLPLNTRIHNAGKVARDAERCGANTASV